VITIDASAGEDNNQEIVSVAYNSSANEYLVVWSDRDIDNDDDDAPGDIYAQRVSAAGSLISTRVLLSTPPNDFPFDECRPDVAYNSTNNTFLVVWTLLEDPDFPGDQPGYAQGIMVSADLSFIGFIQDYGDSSGDEVEDVMTRVAYNPTNNEFLVVWERNTDINGRYAGGTGTPLGSPFTINSTSSEGAVDPNVAYNNATHNEYLVVWEDEDDSTESHQKVIGRFVAGNQGGVMGSNIDITTYDDDNGDPDVSFCPARDAFLVVFENNEENSIEGRYVTPDSLDSIFSISPDPDPANEFHQRDDPSIEFGSVNSTFLVTFENEDYTDDNIEFIESETVSCSVGAIPTLNEWGMIILSLFMAATAVWYMQKRKEQLS